VTKDQLFSKLQSPEETMPELLEANGLIVSERSFSNMILAQLNRKFGVVFPTIGPSDSMGLVKSFPLVSLAFDAGLRRLLATHDYSIEEQRDCWRIGKGYVRWFVYKGKHQKIDFHAWWSPPTQERENFHFERKPSIPENGTRILLETDPMAGGGNHEDAVRLAMILRAANYALSPLIEELCDNGGAIDLAWEDLKVEPHVSLEKFFMDFVDSFKLADGANPMGNFINDLARIIHLSPLHPSPFYRSNGERMILTTSGRVRESSAVALRTEWLEQLYTLGETKLPQRPK
jgi:hypothetical protein